MVYEFGQEILQCHPFAHIVLKSKREYVCDFCLKNAFEVLNKCGACKKVYYCQRECQKKAWKSYHKYECEVLVNPENNNWENQNMLVGRIMQKIIHCGGNEEFVELPDGRKIYFKDLRSEIEDNVKTDIGVLDLEFGGMAFQKRWCAKIGMIVNINMFTIFDDSQFRQIGIGIYLAFSKIQHSCAPNAVLVFNGKIAIIKAIAKVEKFSDLRISYLNNYLRGEEVNLNTEKRREYLKDIYSIHCKCQICEDEKIDQLKSSVICVKCKG